MPRMEASSDQIREIGASVVCLFSPETRHGSLVLVSLRSWAPVPACKDLIWAWSRSLSSFRDPQAASLPHSLEGRRRQAAGDPDLPFWNDHFVCPGKVRLELSPASTPTRSIAAPSMPRGGDVRAVERRNGKDPGQARATYRFVRRGMVVGRAARSPPGRGHRAAHAGRGLARRSGHHLVEQPDGMGQDRACPTEPLVRFDGKRFYHVWPARTSERAAHCCTSISRPLAIAGPAREYPSPMKFVERPGNSWASGSTSRSRSGGTCRSGWPAGGRFDRPGQQPHVPQTSMSESEAWGRPRDVAHDSRRRWATASGRRRSITMS